MTKDLNKEDDYSRRRGSFFSQMFAELRNPLLSAYALLRKSVFIKNILNRSGIQLYKKTMPVLNELQKEIVDDLKNGIAITNLNNLFPEKEIISHLVNAVKTNKEVPSLSKSKSFLRYSLGRGSVIDLSSPLNQLSLEPKILEIVNSYLGICAKLRYFELTTSNLISKDDIPIGSQRWHRSNIIWSL